MAIRKKKVFRTAREKNKKTAKLIKIMLGGILFFLIIYALMNRVALTDYIRSYFY